MNRIQTFKWFDELTMSGLFSMLRFDCFAPLRTDALFKLYEEAAVPAVPIVPRGSRGSA
jgi:hypothetical protein